MAQSACWEEEGEMENDLFSFFKLAQPWCVWGRWGLVVVCVWGGGAHVCLFCMLISEHHTHSLRSAGKRCQNITVDLLTH